MAQKHVWLPPLEPAEATGGVVDAMTAGAGTAGPSAPPMPVMAQYERVTRPYERFGKPLLDMLVAALVLLIALPLMAVITVALWISMGRPILYRQPRVGRDGTTFTIYKFRTMLADRRRGLPSTYDGPERRKSHKTRNDPRVTPLGRFLRKWSLDELPQFWNVLRGDMSLVGPRPELIHIVNRYEPWQHERHIVKPGLTGLWQVSGRSDGAMHEHVDIDLQYVGGVSFRTDLRILLRTIPAVLGKSVGF